MLARPKHCGDVKPCMVLGARQLGNLGQATSSILREVRLPAAAVSSLLKTCWWFLFLCLAMDIH